MSNDLQAIVDKMWILKYCMYQPGMLLTDWTYLDMTCLQGILNID